MKPTYRRSWAGNLLMFSDLILGPSFKVKRWFTGFGELSFQWIQICIGLVLKDTLSIEDEKLFQACRSICSSVSQSNYRQAIPPQSRDEAVVPVVLSR